MIYEAHWPVSDLQKSIEFYKKLGLELAYVQEKLAFLWIDKEESWLGLWESDNAHLAYHPSNRHIAFKMDKDDFEHVKDWLQSIDIEILNSIFFHQSNNHWYCQIIHMHTQQFILLISMVIH
ncbi:VOC family protein [Lysinibacillus parviboronicapiens]|uniref:VOC family protein n=1 Tax=Lysinibacillus parviboronicapiens TaxID=436516 RepID=UPI001EE6A48B|nr:VOC family protein [Lysinibacillus parviboronicapiens]